MLVLGDAHATDPDNRQALFAAYDDANEDTALQLGDLLTYDLPIPTWFIAGNNEDFDVIDALRKGEQPAGVENAHLLASSVVEHEGVRIAGLSGNYAPTRYEYARSELEGERRRHFTHEDIERLADLQDIDVLLSHEAPTGFIYKGYDAGCEYIDELLEVLEPELCLLGHHHQHKEGMHGETRLVSLAPVWESYYLLDLADRSLERRPTPTP